LLRLFEPLFADHCALWYESPSWLTGAAPMRPASGHWPLPDLPVLAAKRIPYLRVSAREESLLIAVVNVPSLDAPTFSNRGCLDEEEVLRRLVWLSTAQSQSLVWLSGRHALRDERARSPHAQIRRPAKREIFPPPCPVAPSPQLQNLTCSSCLSGLAMARCKFEIPPENNVWIEARGSDGPRQPAPWRFSSRLNRWDGVWAGKDPVHAR
jgi:hypothetical protein